MNSRTPGGSRNWRRGADVVTFDWENISGGALAPLEKITLVRPPRAALEASQDRLREKALFSALDVPVAAHAAVDSRDELLRATAKLGVHGILKTRRMGYDGKGQFVIRRAEDIDEAWSRIGGGGLIYEKFQAFSREVSIIGVRSAAGNIHYYPLTANTHAGGVLRYSVAPFASASLERAARRHLKKVMQCARLRRSADHRVLRGRGPIGGERDGAAGSQLGSLDHRGVLLTSQFENHLRAICDLPLGSTRAPRATPR